MKGEVSSETEVKAPAGAVWEVYGGLQLGQLVDELLPDVLGRIQVLQGDGGVGTIVKLTFPPPQAAAGGPSYMKEMFTKIDNENRIKETELIEGGYKSLGFDLYRMRLEILEKDEATSIIRSTVIYEVNDDDNNQHHASLVSTKPLEIMATVIGNYIANKPGLSPSSVN